MVGSSSRIVTKDSWNGHEIESTVSNQHNNRHPPPHNTEDALGWVAALARTFNGSAGRFRWSAAGKTNTGAWRRFSLRYK
jgi:hypothetical protein